MKTIKQIADEIGVSKQAVYKRSKGRLEAQLLPYTHTVDGVVHIEEQGETLIKSDFAERSAYKGSHTEPHTEAHTNDRLYDILQGELDSKNRQIDTLLEQLAEKDRQLNTAQALHAGTLQQQLIGSSADESPLADEPTPNAPEPEKASDLEEPSIKELYAACGDANNKLAEKLKKMSNDELRAVSSTIYSAFVELRKREKEEKRGFFGLFRRKS
jgi:cellobiose-specific phosphotransferase system component IIA